jgi:hypothetical protein
LMKSSTASSAKFRLATRFWPRIKAWIGVLGVTLFSLRRYSQGSSWSRSWASKVAPRCAGARQEATAARHETSCRSGGRALSSLPLSSVRTARSQEQPEFRAFGAKDAFDARAIRTFGARGAYYRSFGAWPLRSRGPRVSRCASAQQQSRIDR